MNIHYDNLLYKITADRKNGVSHCKNGFVWLDFINLTGMLIQKSRALSRNHTYVYEIAHIFKYKYGEAFSAQPENILIKAFYSLFMVTNQEQISVTKNNPNNKTERSTYISTTLKLMNMPYYFCKQFTFRYLSIIQIKSSSLVK